MAGVDPKDVVKLSSNENPLGASSKAKAAVAAMRNRLHEYPDSRARALRAAIGTYLDLGIDQIVVGAGSSTLMHGIVAAFTAPGGEVVSLSPSFSVYGEIAEIHGRRPVELRLRPRDFLLDIERFAAVLTPQTQLVFLTRPNNPTSTLIPLTVFAEAARLAARVGALVVSDEAYIEFADGPDVSAVAQIRGRRAALPNVMVTRTFSKAFGLANLRLGYAIGTRETARLLARANAKWPTGEVAQAAGVAALGDRAHLDRTLATVRAGRRRLVAGFEVLGLPVAPDPQGNYVMVDVSPLGLSAKNFAAELLAVSGILVRGDFSHRHVRISVGRAAENERLLAAVRSMGPGGRRAPRKREDR